MTTINIQTASLDLSNTAPYQAVKGHVDNSGPSFADMLPPHGESQSSSNNSPENNGSQAQHSAHQNLMEKSVGNFSTMERVQTLKHGPQSPTSGGEGRIYTEGHALPLPNAVPSMIFGQKPERTSSQNVPPTIQTPADDKANLTTQSPEHGLAHSEQMASAGAQRVQTTHRPLADMPITHQKIGRQSIVLSAVEEHPTPLPHKAENNMIDGGKVTSRVAMKTQNNIASYGNGSSVIDKKNKQINNRGAAVSASSHYELPHHEIGGLRPVPPPLVASVSVVDLTHNETPNSVTPQTAPTPVGQANLGQITQTISSLAPIGGSAKITLHPETLGSLSIHLNVSEHGVANVRIIASTEAGFQAVRDSSSALAQSMTQAGLIAGPIQVTQAPTPVAAGSQGGQSFSSTMGGSSGQGQQRNNPSSSQNLNQQDVASVRDDTVVAYA